MHYGWEPYGVWRWIFGLLDLGVDGCFALFVCALGVLLFLRAGGAPALAGLRWAGAGLLLWGLSTLLAEVGRFVLYAMPSLAELPYEMLGYQIARLLGVLVDATGVAVTAACLLLVVLGAAAVARDLARSG